jgi:F-type H+-transporting ATPase subunit delta
MIRTGIAERYARALFQAALEAGAADSVFDDARGLIDMKTGEPRLRNFLASPQIPTEDKHALVAKVFAGRAHKLFVDLLHLLIDKKRVMFAQEIAEAYRYLYEKHKGIVAVRAITAVPLDDRSREKLLRTLERQTKKTIRLKHVIDPSIIGGMILKMEDTVIDGSIRFQLDELRRRLAETKVMRASGD